MITYDRVRRQLLTDTEKQRLSYTRKLMQNGRVTKADIMDKLGIAERTAREVINGVGFVYPVAIDTASGNTEYFIAKYKTDEEYNLHKIQDRLSRVAELLRSIMPNFAFEKAAGVDWAELETAVKAFLKVIDAPRIAQLLIETE